jgi:hypothetical protein
LLSPWAALSVSLEVCNTFFFLEIFCYWSAQNIRNNTFDIKQYLEKALCMHVLYYRVLIAPTLQVEFTTKIRKGYYTVNILCKLHFIFLLANNLKLYISTEKMMCIVDEMPIQPHTGNNQQKGVPNPCKIDDIINF